MNDTKWISVKDGLPAFDKPVLGYIPDTKPEFKEDYSVEIVYLNTVTEHAGGKMIEFLGHDYQPREISHWMPLPSPPKE